MHVAEVALNTKHTVLSWQIFEHTHVTSNNDRTESAPKSVTSRVNDVTGLSLSNPSDENRGLVQLAKMIVANLTREERVESVNNIRVT